MERSPIEVFFSYSREDKPLRDKLEIHLSSLKRQGVISSWHDRQIVAGSEWEEEIDRHMRSADIILLLVSPDFVASDYCHEIELPIAMARHEAEDVCVVPILLRPVEGWEKLPFAKLQVYPSGGKPITLWSNRDSAFVDVATGIRGAVENLSEQRQKHARLNAEKARREQEEQAKRAEQARQAQAQLRAEQAKQEQENQAKWEEEERQAEQARQKRQAHLEAELEAVVGSLRSFLLEPFFELESLFRRKPLIMISAVVFGFVMFSSLGSTQLKTAENFFDRGLARQNQEQSQAAIDDFDQAIKLKPDYADAYYGRGNTRYIVGNIKGAITDYNQAIKFKLDFAYAYHGRGNARAATGDKPGAIADFQKAADLYQKQGNDKWRQEALNRLKELQS